MSTDEIDKYIVRGDLPLSFVWENGFEYWLCLHNIKYYTNKKLYPKYYPSVIRINHLNFVTNGGSGSDIIFSSSEKPTFEECISDFLYWFEINKSKCKQITYYEKTN